MTKIFLESDNHPNDGDGRFVLDGQEILIERYPLIYDSESFEWIPQCPTELPVLQESQIDDHEHQDNADVHDQPFQESMPEEQNVDTDDYGDQHEDVKHGEQVVFIQCLLN